jgi:glycosyltransferase involved in cell wall biosynthesis
LGVPADNVTVIRNWTHLKPTPAADLSATRAQHGWRDDETVVLHCGNMGAKQGLDNVIAAAREADERGLPVRFVLVGNGSERDRLVAAAQGVERIQFVGSLDDDAFQATLASADVLLVNEKEGVSEMAVPSKLTSYFNAGRPVVAATDPAGITAAEVEAAQAGIVVPAGQPAMLVEAAWRLREDPRSADHFGANGLEFRRTVLDESHAVEALAALLDRLSATR